MRHKVAQSQPSEVYSFFECLNDPSRPGSRSRPECPSYPPSQPLLGAGGAGHWDGGSSSVCGGVDGNGAVGSFSGRGSVGIRSSGGGLQSARRQVLGAKQKAGELLRPTDSCHDSHYMQSTKASQGRRVSRSTDGEYPELAMAEDPEHEMRQSSNPPSRRRPAVGLLQQYTSPRQLGPLAALRNAPIYQSPSSTLQPLVTGRADL